MARSIENIGLLQPFVVRRNHEAYEVVFGNHRLEACKSLGIRKVPVIIQSFTDDEALLARVSENLARNSYVDPVEEAEGYRILVEKGWTINAIGRRVGKSDSYICERLGFLERLSSDLRRKVSAAEGHLTPSHAELLSRVRDPSRQKQLAELVERKRLSVRALEGMLNGVPLPTRVLLEDSSGETLIRIPSEFANALEFIPGRYVQIHVRGRKLIVENSSRPRGKGDARNRLRTSHVRKL